MAKTNLLLTAELALSVLSYDPDTGALTWRYRPDAVRGWNTRYAGKRAERNSGRYVRISIHKNDFLAHRLVWLMTHGSWPSNQIDHINNDGFDNRLVNLREANQSENPRNCKIRRSNTVGFKGVSFHTGKWVAGIRIDGRRRHLGRFSTPEDAHAAYCKAATELHGEFARFG